MSPRRLAAQALVWAPCVVCAPLASCQNGGDVRGEPPDAAVDVPVTGALAVSTYGCGQCHQASDPVDGVLSGQTTPVPGTQAFGSNLTPDPDTGMDGWDAGTIARAILQGTDNLGTQLCPEMPTYADAGMSAEVAAAIADYLRGLPAVRHPVPASVCPPIKLAADAGADAEP